MELAKLIEKTNGSINSAIVNLEFCLKKII